MDGHKEGGKFHPHTKHQSAVHSSDVNQDRIKTKKAMWATRNPKGYSNQPSDPTKCMMGGRHVQMKYKFGEKFQTCTKCGNYIKKVYN